MSQPQPKPTKIQLPDGEQYEAVVLEVVERLESGKPHTMRLVRENETVDLRMSTREFWIVFAPSQMVR